MSVNPDCQPDWRYHENVLTSENPLVVLGDISGASSYVTLADHASFKDISVQIDRVASMRDRDTRPTWLALVVVLWLLSTQQCGVRNYSILLSIVGRIWGLATHIYTRQLLAFALDLLLIIYSFGFILTHFYQILLSHNVARA